MAGLPRACTRTGAAASVPAVSRRLEAAGRSFENDFSAVFPDTIPVPPSAPDIDIPAPRAPARHRHRFKLLAGSMVLSVALLLLARPGVDPVVVPGPARPAAPLSAPQDSRFESHVRRVQALQAHRALAGACVAAVRRQAPEIAARGRPTLIHIEGPACDAQCVSAQRHSEQLHAHWTGLHLNGIRVSTQTPRGADTSAMRRVEAPACATLVSAQQPTTLLVLDRDGHLFFAGEEENRLKAQLWLRKPGPRPAAGPPRGGQALNLLLQSGRSYRTEEAVLTVTTARSCKWHLGECSDAAAEHRAARRLDDTAAEQLVKDGEAEARRRKFLVP